MKQERRAACASEIAALIHVVSEKPDVIDLYVFRSYANYAWDWPLANGSGSASRQRRLCEARNNSPARFKLAGGNSSILIFPNSHTWSAMSREKRQGMSSWSFD
jgi:hypothetical protein